MSRLERTRADVLAEAWERVKADKGAAGIDGQRLFEADLEDRSYGCRPRRSATGLGACGVTAWGPRGFYYEMITQGTLENAEWQRNVTPEMRLLFLEQLDRNRHAARWVEGGRKALLSKLRRRDGFDGLR